jgi:hypothetical protein
MRIFSSLAPFADPLSSAILNPKGPRYKQLKSVWLQEYEDNYWAEDAIFMERNSRDFVLRNERINVNAEAIYDVLHSHPLGIIFSLSLLARRARIALVTNCACLLS